MRAKKKKVSPAVHDELRRVRAAVDAANSGAPDGTPELQHAEKDFTPATPAIEKIADVAPVQSALQPKRGPGRPRKAEAAASPLSPPTNTAAAAAPLEITDFVLTEEQIAGLLPMLGNFASGAVTLITKLPHEQIAGIWNFSPREVDALAPPTTKLANKYFPLWLKKYGDEIAMLIVLLPILTAKLTMTIALRAQLAAAATEPVQPVKPNGSAAHQEAHA